MRREKVKVWSRKLNNGKLLRFTIVTLRMLV